MKLSKEQIKQVQDALLTGFDEASLRMMVRIELGEDLEEVAGGDSLTLRVRVFNLIDWAERHDRIFDLIDGARAQVDTNIAVQRVWQASQQWRQPAGSETADDSTGVGVDQFGDNRGQPPRRAWLWIGLAAVLLVSFIVWFLVNTGGFQIVRVIPTPLPVVESQITPSPPSSPGTADTDDEAISAALQPTETASATITPTPAPSSTATTKPTSTATATGTSTPEWTNTWTPVPTATQSVLVTPPKAGERRTNLVDGAIYVYVPGGPFIMGSDDEPQQPDLYLDAFWIMQTEVTNAQYAKCVEAGVCSDPGSGNTQWRDPTSAKYPVTHVDWYQASKYAQWAGGCLPTEAEWEKAARGTDGREYPWGNEPPTEYLANFGMNIGTTTPVGNYPKGASPYGVLDMVGNVWEWTSSWAESYPYDANDGRENPEGDGLRVLRGGSWGYGLDFAAASFRYWYFPVDLFDDLGFRVVACPSP